MTARNPFYRQEGPHSISLDDDGLYINNKLVLTKFGKNYIPSHISISEKQLVNLHEVSKLLERGLTAPAILIAATSSSWSEKADTSRLPAGLSKENFNQDEPRGYHARWIKAGDETERTRGPFEEVQNRRAFHDLVVDDFLAGLAAAGAKVGKDITFTSISGVPTIPDGISLPNSASIPYLIEVKTGGDPPFTPNQQYVYPLLCIGNHVVSNDPRISSFGLPVGKPLPPLDILAVHTDGPGKPFSFIDLCKAYGLRK